MTRKLLARSMARAAAIAAVGAALASCSGHGGSSMMVMMPPAPAPDPIAAFGTAFATDFEASTTSAPAVPATGDIIPLSLTTTPMTLPPSPAPVN